MDAHAEAVKANIKQKVLEGRFNDKVEPSDPVLSPQERSAELERILARNKTLGYKLKRFVARTCVDLVSLKYTAHTKMIGLENIRGLKGAAIVTSNHFSPFESMIIRRMAAKMHRGPLRVVSQDTNFLMPGWKGFFLRYTDLIPVSKDRSYMAEHFEEEMRKALKGGHFVLIYPEQEMWLNYRKPRPLKRGAYHYACKFNVPVIPCFVQIEDKAGHFSLHIMKPIYPDPFKSLKENSLAMMQQDMAYKKGAYEKAFGKPLDYTFEDWDIAG